jgi:nicotinamidase-related amidase
MLQLTLRSQRLERGPNDRTHWEVTEERVHWPSRRTALLLCDVWDRHWSRGANERLAAMVGRMDEVVRAARQRGVLILHAPSDTMPYYEGTPARQRLLSAPPVEPPAELPHEDPPLPVDAEDGGSDTGEPTWHKAWTRQHPAIGVDHERDGIADDGRQVYSYLRTCGADHLLIMGVHTNMCVLGRSFGIRQMVRWGVRIALVRDLTDAMYNPARAPYVSHEEGTRLVIEYIEKFWCPSVLSRDVA